MTEFLVVGLGNPGREYEQNRHNIGFMALDVLSNKFGTGNPKNAFQSIMQTATIHGKQVLLQKPQTYMNLSGEAVGAAARFYKIPVENIIVLHDELDIAAETIRIKQGGGAGGHNGIKSIDQYVGNNTWRVRLGIGHPGDKDRVTGHVLGNFTNAELDWVEPMLKKLADNFTLMLNGQSAKLSALFKPKPVEKEVAPE